MPENDDLFRTYNDQGLPVHPLPASEVRRRGDRRRHRRTALATVGTVAAVGIVVATPLALLADGTDSSRPVDPAGTSRGVEWRTTVPDELPLLDSMPEGTERLDDYEQQVVGPCGGDGFTADGAADTEDALWTDGVEGGEQRTVAVYADDGAAAAAVQDVRDQLAACEQPARRGQSIVAVEQPSDLGEESFVFVNSWYADGELDGSAHVHQLVRVGNAVLHDNASFFGAGDEAVVDRTVEQVREDSAYVVSSLCLFAADPCAEPPTRPEPDEVAGSAETAIPGSISLAAGIPADGDAEVIGPDEDGDGVDLSSLCGTGLDTWPADPAERLALAVAGPESTHVRELATYPSVEEAGAVLEGVRAAVGACASVGGTRGDPVTWTELEAPGAPEASVSFAQTRNDGAPGGSIYQLVRVGNAVLATSWGAEWSPASLEPGIAELTQADAAVVEQLTPVFGG